MNRILRYRLIFILHSKFSQAGTAIISATAFDSGIGA